MTLAKIPRRFYRDHADRDLPTPPAIKNLKRAIWIDAADPAAAELLDDARHYGDNNAPGDVPPQLRQSARATVRALEPLVGSDDR